MFKEPLCVLENQLEVLNDEIEELEKTLRSPEYSTKALERALQEFEEIRCAEVPLRRSNTQRKWERQSLEEICRSLGADAQEFRSIDVIRQVNAQPSSLDTPRPKVALIYSDLIRLQKQGVLKKVRRGQWKLNG